MSAPPILLHDRFPHQLVVAPFREEHGPEEPVHGTEQEESRADNAMQPIRQRLVYIVSVCWRDERRDNQIRIGQRKHHHHRKRRANRRRPVILRLIEVNMDEPESDEEVDDRERVGDDVQDEVVGVAGRGREHDDDRDDPVLKETGEGSVEGFAGGEEAGEGEDAFAAEFLDDAALREDDGEDVAEGRERDEDGEGFFSFLTWRFVSE